MAKSKTIRVVSRAHTALTLQEPMPNPEKPGEAPPLRTVTLGANGEVTNLSEDDAEVFNAWKAANKDHVFMRDGILEEVGDDYEAPSAVYGHEAILEAALKDKDAVKASKEGSMVTEEGPVPAEALSPASDGVPGDDPGEPRHASQPGEPEPVVRRRGRASE